MTVLKVANRNGTKVGQYHKPPNSYLVLGTQRRKLARMMRRLSPYCWKLITYYRKIYQKPDLHHEDVKRDGQ
jgi:transposase InsO family protein